MSSLIDTTFNDAAILVIDADAEQARRHVRVLEKAGYGSVRACTNPAALTASLASALNGDSLDLIVLDAGPKEPESLALLRDLRERLPRDEFLPIMIIGMRADAGSRIRALKAGAKDYMDIPLDLAEFLARVESLLETRFLSRRLKEGKRALEEMLKRRTRQSENSDLELLERLARVAELRDDPTGGHPTRVGRLSGLIAHELLLPADETRYILRAAPLHDLGNVGIPDEVVRLEGNYSEEQREKMREHTCLGAYLLQGAASPVLKVAEEIALNHHERWDGLGYPRGLRRVEIPMPARIVAVADAFDAMTHPRLYKEPCSVKDALDEIKRESGWQFDPEVVAALLRIHERQPGMLTITPRAKGPSHRPLLARRHS